MNNMSMERNHYEGVRDSWNEREKKIWQNITGLKSNLRLT